jgi:hypothetical protein
MKEFLTLLEQYKLRIKCKKGTVDAFSLWEERYMGEDETLIDFMRRAKCAHEVELARDEGRMEIIELFLDSSNKVNLH